MMDREQFVKDQFDKIIFNLENQMLELEKELKQLKEEHTILVKILKMLEDK